MADPSQANRRMKTVQSARCSTQLEGASSTAATRADQLAYVQGTITAAQLGDQVRQRYGVL